MFDSLSNCYATIVKWVYIQENSMSDNKESWGWGRVGGIKMNRYSFRGRIPDIFVSFQRTEKNFLPRKRSLSFKADPVLDGQCVQGR